MLCLENEVSVFTLNSSCIVTFLTTCQDARIQDSSPILHLGDSVVHESQSLLDAA